jgi:mercuric reductase
MEMLFNRTTKTDFDLFVLGGGSAAFAAAIRAAELGARVGVAEEGVIGGTCVNRGCVPSKNLLYAAERYHDYARNGFAGLPQGREPANFAQVITQKDDLVEGLRKAKYWDILEAFPQIKFLPHRAAFVSPNEVSVGDQKVTADHFIIATGASAARLPVPGMERTPHLTYKEALDLKQLPKSLVVIGGGPIGLELGQVYARFGSKVTILEALPRIAPLEDEDISEALKGYLTEEGIEILTAVKVTQVEPVEGGVRVEALVDNRSTSFFGERLLLAAGLKPNTRDLGLHKAGVKHDERGAIVVDDQLRTTAKSVWAAGDVTGQMMLVTVSAMEGGIAAENALSNARRRIDLTQVPHAIFTSPQVASIGLRERDAVAAGRNIQTAKLPFEHVPKAAAVRDTRGLLKLVVDGRNYRVLGAHLVAAEAADLIHIGVLAVQQGLTVGDLLRTTFVYPTLAEAFKIAALSFKKDVTKLSCCAT